MLRRNIELKAGYDDLDYARRAVEELGARFSERQVQSDTYFNVPNGRLKLREIEGKSAELIGYNRPDDPGYRTSNYYLVNTNDLQGLKAALSAALGIRGVVSKTREIFLYRNVRIHLDRVEGLGTFIEFEAVMAPGEDDAESQQRLDMLHSALGIEPSQHYPSSYSDMLGI